jgi:ribosome-binding protein aMBF1 (putative translation factor)
MSNEKSSGQQGHSMHAEVTIKPKEGDNEMKFSELDEKVRASMTPVEAEHHDRRRAELVAQLRAGMALRDARESAGLTQTELAAKIGIAQSALSRIESGRSNITLAMFRRIANALEVDLALEVGGKRAVVSPAA